MVLSNFLNFLIGWLIVYPVFLFFNPAIIFFLPFLVIVLFLNFVFVCGLGLSLSVLNVFFRDLGHLLGVFLMFWFWITPIFYSIKMVPANFRWMTNFNPMSSYVVYFRLVVLKGDLPSLSASIAIFTWAVFSILSGILLFSRLESKLLKQI